MSEATDQDDAWACRACGQGNGKAFDVCWNCGTGVDGSPPADEFLRGDFPVPDNGGRDLRCLRCGQPMLFAGQLQFHEGSQLAPAFLGGLGELLVNREAFDTMACRACGKAEFFLPASRRPKSERDV